MDSLTREEQDEYDWLNRMALAPRYEEYRKLKARVAELETHADDVEESQSLAARQRDEALARVVELTAIIEANVPIPWCAECKVECRLVDEDGCCLGCGVDVIEPTSQHIARLSAYECPEHAKPDYECDVCTEHLRAAGALEEEPPER